MRFINNEARQVEIRKLQNTLVVVGLVGSVVFREPLITVGIYGAGLIYSAVLRIASAFKRTDIVYIQ